MKKYKKQYPVDGPPLIVQKWMQSPRTYRKELAKWAKEMEGKMRKETLDACLPK